MRKCNGRVQKAATLVAAASIVILVSPGAAAASFNCANASNFIERQICADESLSALDDEMAQLYKNALLRSSNSGAIKLAQRAWLKEIRSKCADSRCLAAVYTARIEDLSQHRPTIPGVTTAPPVRASSAAPQSSAAAVPAPAFSPVARLSSVAAAQFNTPKFQVSIDSYRIVRDFGGQLFQASDKAGAVYVVVRYRYMNTTKQPMNSLFSTPTVSLKDGEGVVYVENRNATFTYKIANNIDSNNADSINPRITIADVAVFEVSDELFNPKTWQVAFNADTEVEVNIRSLPKH